MNEQYEWCKAQIKERELESMDQQTTRYVSRFEPLLYVPAFTQKDFQSTNLSTQDYHTGNLHWGFGATTNGSTQLLSQPIQPLTRGNTNTTSHKRGRHLAKQPQSTSSLRGIQTQSPPLTRGSQPPLHNQPLHKRDTTNKEGLPLGGLSQPQITSFTKQRS